MGRINETQGMEKQVCRMAEEPSAYQGSMMALGVFGDSEEGRCGGNTYPRLWGHGQIT